MAISFAELASSTKLFQAFRAVRYHDKESARLATQASVLNLMRALAGSVPVWKIKRMVGDAKTPNDVSRAARNLRLR